MVLVVMTCVLMCISVVNYVTYASLANCRQAAFAVYHNPLAAHVPQAGLRARGGLYEPTGSETDDEGVDTDTSTVGLPLPDPSAGDALGVQDAARPASNIEGPGQFIVRNAAAAAPESAPPKLLPELSLPAAVVPAVSLAQAAPAAVPSTPRSGTTAAATDREKVSLQAFEDLMAAVYVNTSLPASSAAVITPAAIPPAAPAPMLPVVPLKKRRIILTISTGHTGTMWLVRVLRCSGHPIVAEHEPKPSLVSFHQVLLHGLNKTYQLRRDEKWPRFLDMMHNATKQPGTIYAEISHMFIKSWADLFTDWLAAADPTGEIYDVDIVVLRRYLPFVMRSFLTDKQSWNPVTNLRTWSGGEYTIQHRNYAILPSLYEHGMEDSVDMLLGYLVDMELQYLAFRAKYPQFRYIDYRAEELFTVAGARKLLGILGLEPAIPRCMTILGTARPVNQHVSWKGPHLLNVTTDVFVSRFLLYKMRYEASGVPFPYMPQVNEFVPCNSTSPDTWCEIPAPTMSIADIKKILLENPIPNNASPVKTPKLKPVDQ
jgi:hypothetical protein